MTHARAQAASGASDDDSALQLEPLRDSLQALEQRLDAGGSSGTKSRRKKEKKRALTGGEKVQKNTSTPIMRLA